MEWPLRSRMGLTYVYSRGGGGGKGVQKYILGSRSRLPAHASWDHHLLHRPLPYPRRASHKPRATTTNNKINTHLVGLAVELDLVGLHHLLHRRAHVAQPHINASSADALLRCCVKEVSQSTRKCTFICCGSRHWQQAAPAAAAHRCSQPLEQSVKPQSIAC